MSRTSLSSGTRAFWISTSETKAAPCGSAKPSFSAWPGFNSKTRATSVGEASTGGVSPGAMGALLCTVEPLGLGGFLERLAARQRVGHGLRLLLAELPHLVLGDARADALLHLGQRENGGLALRGEADDVVAEGGLDEVGDLAGLESEDRVVELGHHASRSEAAEVAAVLGGALVLGGLLREGGEVAPGLHLVEEPLRELLRLGVRVSLAGVARLHLDEDVARAGLLLLTELLAVVLVVQLDVPLGHRHQRLESGAVEEDVGDDTLLRNPVGVLLRLEAGRNLFLGRLDGGTVARGVGEDVLELHLLGAASELALDLGVAHRHRCAHQALQALAQELASQRVLEVLLGEALQLEPAADLGGADEPAAVLELGRGGDRARDRLVGDGDAEAPALELDQAVADEALEHLFLEPQLAQHVLVEPALVEPVVDLALAAVGPLELTDRDGEPAHLHHRLPRRALPDSLAGWGCTG